MVVQARLLLHIDSELSPSLVLMLQEGPNNLRALPMESYTLGTITNARRCRDYPRTSRAGHEQNFISSACKRRGSIENENEKS